MSYTETIDFEIPTIEEIFLLRRNRGVYKWVCNNILPEVIGYREFVKLCNYEPLHKFITISDEAFILLCIKNYYNTIKYKVQTEMFNINNKTQNNNSNNQLLLEEKNKGTPPLYTKAGATTKASAPSTCFKYSGWTVEGIIEYNKLQDAVEEDCNKYSDFDTYFMKFKQDETKRNHGNNKKSNNDFDETQVIQKTSWNEFKKYYKYK